MIAQRISLRWHQHGAMRNTLKNCDIWAVWRSGRTRSNFWSARSTSYLQSSLWEFSPLMCSLSKHWMSCPQNATGCSIRFDTGPLGSVELQKIWSAEKSIENSSRSYRICSVCLENCAILQCLKCDWAMEMWLLVALSHPNLGISWQRWHFHDHISAIIDCSSYGSAWCDRDS